MTNQDLSIRNDARVFLFCNKCLTYDSNVSISEILHISQICMEIPALQAVFTLTSATYAWYGTNNKVERQLSRRAVPHLY